jgi:hypothetical protein
VLAIGTAVTALGYGSGRVGAAWSDRLGTTGLRRAADEPARR